MSDAVSEAAARLERAVERLAAALAARPSPQAGVPPETVAALSARLDDTLARLRGALADMEGAEAAVLPDEDEVGLAGEGEAATPPLPDSSSKGG